VSLAPLSGAAGRAANSVRERYGDRRFVWRHHFHGQNKKFSTRFGNWRIQPTVGKSGHSKLTNSMNKICPECGKPPIERGLIKCHVCGVPFVEESEMGLKLSKSQLEQISKNLVNSWRFWVCFSAVFLVALLIIGVPTVTVIGVHYATKSLNASLANFNAQASNKLTTAYLDNRAFLLTGVCTELTQIKPPFNNLKIFTHLIPKMRMQGLMWFIRYSTALAFQN